MAVNALYYGDNLEVLRQHVADESVDLIYLDPPFNSNADYSIFFKEKNGAAAAAQIKAFKDTWHWDQGAARTYEDIVEAGGSVSDALQAFRKFLGANDLLAYLTMMAPRLKELHRVLRPTGSLYLHCDPTASHYLKMLMDAVWGPMHFMAEIVWKRHNARGTTQNWPHIHDVILFYSKTSAITYNPTQVAGDMAKVPHTLITGTDGKKYQTYELTGPHRTRHGESGKAWRGFDPGELGRHWANSHSTMDEWDKAGLIHWPRDGGFPRRKADEPFDAEARMVTVGDVWADIDRINQSAKERLHYPTQKPVALLKRILAASSKPGDVILDPFCGCGTTIDATEQVNRESPDQPPRRWIGIDITHLAINLIKYRLNDAFGDSCKYKVIGEPTSLPDARQLAEEDAHQFQQWALGLVRARPDQEHSKGADQGIDGVRHFHDEREAGATKTIIFSVKGGKNLHANMVRDLLGVLSQEKAEIGVLISMYPPTEPMRGAAASAGFYSSPGWGTKHPRLQLLTIEELLAGKKVDMPPTRDERTFKKAARYRPARPKDKDLPMSFDGKEKNDRE